MSAVFFTLHPTAARSFEQCKTIADLARSAVELAPGFLTFFKMLTIGL
jgi:hypothetical protein